jgi:hypothetical protein
MIDWMIEVLTNFRCDDQTFFLASSLMDRYFKNCPGPKEVGDLHVIGVTTMFLASKFEDIYPLKMKTVYEKIAHKKLEIERIKELELDIMKVIDYDGVVDYGHNVNVAYFAQDQAEKLDVNKTVFETVDDVGQQPCPSVFIILSFSSH